MIYVQFIKESDIRVVVDFIHYMPFDEVYGLGKIKDELETTGRLVNELPPKKDIAGKNAILFINPKTKELWYEYVDKPITEGDDLTVIRSHVLQQSEALTNARDAIAYQSEEILNLRAEIEALKGGQS